MDLDNIQRKYGLPAPLPVVQNGKLATRFPLDLEHRGDDLFEFGGKYIGEIENIYDLLYKILTNQEIDASLALPYAIKITEDKLYVRDKTNSEWILIFDITKPNFPKEIELYELIYKAITHQVIGEDTSYPGQFKIEENILYVRDKDNLTWTQIGDVTKEFLGATEATQAILDQVNEILIEVQELKTELNRQIATTNETLTTALQAANEAMTSAQSINIRTFNSVEEMKASNTLKAGALAKTLGFYTADDGGGADYVITNDIGEDETDEASIIALQNGLYAKLLTNNYINIKQWGAYGNAANDDTDIFEKAINYINNNKKMLYLPIGRYKITRDLPSIYSGANIVGEVMGYDITDTTGTVICDNRKSNEPLFRFVSNNQQMGGCIKNIDFQSQNHADTTYETSGLSLEGSGYDYILENLRFVNYEGTIIKSSCIGAKLKDITVISCGSSIKRDTPKYAIDIAGSMHMCNQIHMEHCRYAYKISGIAHRFINCYLEMSGRGITEETSSPIVIDTSGTSSTCSFVGCEYINIPYVAYSKETPVYLFKVNGNSNNSINVTNVTINSCIVNNGRGSGVYEIPSSVPNSGICFLKTENGNVNVLIEGCSLNNLTTNTYAISSSSIVSLKNTEFRYVCLELTGDYSSINRETKLGVYTGDGSCIGCSFYVVLNTYTINQIDFLILTSLNSNSIFSNYRRYTDGTKGELVAAGGITYGQAYK
ncbi:hypothetical protein DW639_02600 [Megamonas funiformis]|uniref:glycosyl hydrolase family 28-related protein n=1 Tax=Megamonas funiformis TaxID=437897 RepID=UPI000E555CFB|nr:glycosyl hydrolase family 28-related protein [Megamonas funiformis]RHG11834.1 hypothetical protein DW639_02600 [Megamonas funiformis]